MSIRFLFCLVVLNLFLLLKTRANHDCIDNKGLSDTKNGFELHVNTLSIPNDGIYTEFLSRVKKNYLPNYEGPIAHRLILLSTSVVFSSMSSFHETSFDFFAREKESFDRRRCQPSDDETEKEKFNLYRRVTMAYSLYFALTQFIPESRGALDNIMVKYNLPQNICEKNNFDCSDVSTAWGLSSVIVNEVNEFGKYDGFNADGSLSREFNKIPYQDFRGPNRYIPKNSPWKLKRKKYWQPLLESDSKGFLFNQEHVTPHIGYTAKSFFLGDRDICSRQVEAPRYNYRKQMKLTLKTLADLTDYQKMEIELFDNKVASIVSMVADYYEQNGSSLDSFNYISADVMILSTLYESVLVAWKEKVYWNAVRPPSIIHAQYGKKKVRSYAGRTIDGKSEGTKFFAGEAWEPYIRTMPHAEYPSGSACLCSAYANALIKFLGDDNFENQVGSIKRVYKPKSSKLEPKSTPREKVEFEFKKWSEISYRCGVSRINGGMHFTKAVPSSAKMCETIGDIVANAFDDIIHGKKPKYIVDIKNHEIPNRETQC